MSMHEDEGVSNTSGNVHLESLVEQRPANPSRRDAIRRGFGLATISFLGTGSAAALSACGGDDDDPTPTAATARPLGFSAVNTSTGDGVIVPSGYSAQTILLWGDQEQQIGDNHDGMHFFGLQRGRRRLRHAQRRRPAGDEPRVHQPEYFYAPEATPPTGCCRSPTRRRARGWPRTA
jgi:uncharacterized protein